MVFVGGDSAAADAVVSGVSKRSKYRSGERSVSLNRYKAFQVEETRRYLEGVMKAPPKERKPYRRGE